MTLIRTLLVFSLLLVAGLALGAGDEGRGARGGGNDEWRMTNDESKTNARSPKEPNTNPKPTTAAMPASDASGSHAPTSAGAAKKADGGYLPYSEPGLPDSPGLLSVAGRVVGSLALVVGLVFVTAVGLKRFLGGKKTPVTSRKVTELVEVTPLGGKRYLYLIRVADRLLVVGAGGERLELLTEISDPTVLATVAAMPRQSQFLELFHRLRAKEAPVPEQLPAQC